MELLGRLLLVERPAEFEQNGAEEVSTDERVYPDLPIFRFNICIQHTCVLRQLGSPQSTF